MLQHVSIRPFKTIGKKQSFFDARISIPFQFIAPETAESEALSGVCPCFGIENQNGSWPPRTTESSPGFSRWPGSMGAHENVVTFLHAFRLRLAACSDSCSASCTMHMKILIAFEARINRSTVFAVYSRL